MFDVTVDGLHYQVSFVHSTPFKSELVNKDGVDQFECKDWAGEKKAIRARIDTIAEGLQRRVTLCSIAMVGYDETRGGEAVDHYESLGEGFGVCHPKDNFDKAVGRYVAFEAAIEAAELPSGLRGPFWNAFRAFARLPKTPHRKK